MPGMKQIYYRMRSSRLPLKEKEDLHVYFSWTNKPARKTACTKMMREDCLYKEVKNCRCTPAFTDAMVWMKRRTKRAPHKNNRVRRACKHVNGRSSFHFHYAWLPVATDVTWLAVLCKILHRLLVRGNYPTRKYRWHTPQQSCFLKVCTSC